MRKFIILLLLFLSIAGLSCSDNGAKEIFDVAHLEEQQRAFEHAEKLYNEVIQKYPESPYAAQARSRLAAMKAQTAK